MSPLAFMQRLATQVPRPRLHPIGSYGVPAPIARLRPLVARKGGDLEFCSINPSVAPGPVWSRDRSASVVIVNKLLQGALPALPDIGLGVVDARDVADLHARALTAPGLAGERFIASGPLMKLRDIAAVPTRKPGADARLGE